MKEAADVDPDGRLGVAHRAEQGRTVLSRGLDEAERRDEGLPDLAGGGELAELLDRVVRQGLEGGARDGVGRRGRADDAVALGQQTGQGEVLETRDDLSSREVARRAKEHDHVTRGDLDVGLDRVGDPGHRQGRFSTWPPNSARIADSTRAANRPRSRDS